MKFFTVCILSAVGVLAMEAPEPIGVPQCTAAHIKELIRGNMNNPGVDAASMSALQQCLLHPPQEYNAYANMIDAIPEEEKKPRYFIFAIGPCASGKGTALRQTLFPHLGIPVDTEAQKDVLRCRDIDGLIANTKAWNIALEEYQREDMIEMSQTYLASTPAEKKALRTEVKDYLANKAKPANERLVMPTPKIARAFENWLDIFYDINALEHEAYQIFWQLVEDVFSPYPSKHILYETTGCMDFCAEVFFKLAEIMSANGFTPIVAYPIVYKHQLYDRFQERAGIEWRAPDYTHKTPGENSCPVNCFRNAMRVSKAIQQDESKMDGLFVIDNTASKQPRLMLSVVSDLKKFPEKLTGGERVHVHP